MPQFRYQAARADGQVVDGVVQAGDRETVARKLLAQGQTPIRVEEVGEKPTATAVRPKRQRGRLKRASIDHFTFELATLLRAGLPLGQALETLIELAEDEAMGELATRVNRQVRAGQSLSEALDGLHPEFDGFYRNMVRAGESSGALDMALARLAEFRANQRELRQSLLSALLYPAILLVLALVAVAVLLAFVVPQFTQMFAEAGRDMPWLTRAVAAAGQAVTDWWWLMLAVAALGSWLLRRDWRSEAGRASWDGRLLRLPLIGPLLDKLAAARFSRTLATLLGNGVHLVPALGIARQVAGNTVIVRDLALATQRVREGSSLAAALTEVQALPLLARQLIRLGEKSGSLEPMLAQVADIYERDVQNSLRRLLTLAEPAIIVTIAILISVIILSVVLLILESNELAF